MPVEAAIQMPVEVAINFENSTKVIFKNILYSSIKSLFEWDGDNK